MTEAPPVWIVMRCHDDQPWLERTLAALASQDLPHNLLVLDNASRDGSRPVALAAAQRLLDIPQGAYIPGRVLNLGMAQTDGELVVFLNADAVPHGPSWLRDLLAGFDAPEVAAVFGRQVPRPACPPLLAKDTEDTYGDGRRQARWRHCFSMAASAIRRSLWLQMPFREDLRHSEDLDWTWRARQKGWRVRYVPEAVVTHSNHYDLAGYCRRQQGEGRAEASIFTWSAWEAGFLRYALLPCLRQVRDDYRWALGQRQPRLLWQSPLWRAAGLWGRWRGLRMGLWELKHGK